MIEERLIKCERSIETEICTTLDGIKYRAPKYTIALWSYTSKRVGTKYSVSVGRYDSCDTIDGNYWTITELTDAIKLYEELKVRYSATYVKYRITEDNFAEFRPDNWEQVGCDLDYDISLRFQELDNNGDTYGDAYSRVVDAIWENYCNGKI